jgi:hypothetical protein
MILNEEYSFDNVRYAITANSAYKRGYDVGASFVGRPAKTRLEPGTVLIRLDFEALQGLFLSPWWLRGEVLEALKQGALDDAQSLRRDWQHQTAMPKAKKGFRTQVIEIEITSPVYAWVGPASALFHKPGGAEQIYLPNLAKGYGLNGSHFANLRHTYTLPAPA